MTGDGGASGAARRALRLAVGLATLPHEAAHALAIRPWATAVRVEAVPDDPRFAGRRGLDRPLARVDAAVPATTPRWAIRACALAPLAWLGVALAADLLVAPAGVSPATLLATVALAAWATPSDGDWAVAARPDAVREAGALVVADPPGWVDAAGTLSAVAVTLVVGALFVG